MAHRSSRMVRNRHYWSLLSLCSVLFWLTAAKPYAEPFALLVPTDKKRLMSVRDMGRHRVAIAIPDLIAVLTEQPPVNTDLAITAIHSLAQMGAEEALPALDNYVALQTDTAVHQFPDVGLLNFIKAARARLVAEESARNFKTEPQKTNAKVVSLCQELGLSVAGINKAATTYKAQYPGPWHNPPLPVGVYAMREIADIVYDSPVHDLKSVPVANALEGKSDYPSQLKLQLVGLAEAQRIEWLINDLAHKKALTPDQEYELQLVEAYGIPAGNAAVGMLARMDNHRDEYKGGGFDALIHVVYETGYQAAQVQEHYRDDPDPSVSDSARTGVSMRIMPGY
jgi:hypothetical protein